MRLAIAKMDPVETTPEKQVQPLSKKQPRNRKTVVAGGGLCLVVLITIGVLLGTLTTQKSYNGSRDILRALETSSGIKIMLYTTGMYADDGMFQQTNMIILPKDFSKHKTEIVFDAKIEFQRDNTTIAHILKDSKAYTVEMNNTSGEIKSYCANVPEMPHLDGIVDTILNGQVVEEDSEFFEKLQCPQDSHRLIHAVWEGLDFFYCFDTTGTGLGSFLGPAMIGKVEYLSKEELVAFEFQAPPDLTCDAIDLSQLSQNPMEVLDLQESRRRLREMAGGSCEERVRLGTCEYCYTDDIQFPKGASVYNLLSTAFSSLELDLDSFRDLVTPSDFQSEAINIRRLKKKKKKNTYRFEHDGLPCVFINGAGVNVSKSELVDKYDEYWGKSTRNNLPPYCSRVKYLKLNTMASNPFQEISDLLLQVRYSEEGSTDTTIREMIIISHGTSGTILARALQLGFLKFDRTVRWLGLNVPQSAPHILSVTCSSTLESLLEKMAERSKSKLDMSCDRISQADWKMKMKYYAPEFYSLELSAGICGAVASHRKTREEEYRKYFETSETEGLALKTLSDGINRLDHCLTIDGDKVLPKFGILKTNYWDSQMLKADHIKNGGVQHWLRKTATKALEGLVNGEDPDLKYALNSELDQLYEEAEKVMRVRDRLRSYPQRFTLFLSEFKLKINSLKINS